MFAPTALSLLAAVSISTDTTFVLGRVERDLTGDSIPEVLTLVAVGKTLDSLNVTLTIESSGAVLFRLNLAPLTRRTFDAERRRLPEREYRARINGYSGWFFGEEKFLAPAAYVAQMRRNSRRRVDSIPSVISRDRAPGESRSGAQIWEEILASPVTVFSFSPGGDRIMALGWSRTSRRFYQLIECC